MENVKDPRKKFRIMQWNGLAKKLCINTIKYKSQVEAINWEKFRMWRLLQEITRYNSDIICLQEADFYDDIKPYLHDLGYLIDYYSYILVYFYKVFKKLFECFCSKMCVCWNYRRTGWLRYFLSYKYISNPKIQVSKCGRFRLSSLYSHATRT